MLQKWSQIDSYRVLKGNYATREDRKLQRKMRKRSVVKKQGAFQRVEEVQYQSQAFHNESMIVCNRGCGRDGLEHIVQCYSDVV